LRKTNLWLVRNIFLFTCFTIFIQYI
jgi:hypothetical protein